MNEKKNQMLWNMMQHLHLQWTSMNYELSSSSSSSSFSSSSSSSSSSH